LYEIKTFQSSDKGLLIVQNQVSSLVLVQFLKLLGTGGAFISILICNKCIYIFSQVSNIFMCTFFSSSSYLWSREEMWYESVWPYLCQRL